MKINGMDITVTSDGIYRPNTLIINGELASMENFLKAHGFNWKTSASGNILCYRAESGAEYQIKQVELMRG